MPGKLFYKLCMLCGITETFPQKSTRFIEKQSLFLIGNLLIDLLYNVLDPRIKY